MTPDEEFEMSELRREVNDLKVFVDKLKSGGMDNFTEFGYVQWDGIGMRFDENGIQIKTDSATPIGSIYWPGKLSVDPGNAYPRAEIRGYGATGSSIVELRAFTNSTNYADLYAYSGTATNPQIVALSITPTYRAGLSTVARESAALANAELAGSIWLDITALTQIAANTNDYDVGAAFRSSVSISSDAARDITGILATNVNDGAILFIQNTGGFAITLKDASGSSAAANQFAFSGDLILAPDDGCLLQYNLTSTKWRCIGKSSGSAPTTLLLTDTAWAAAGDLVYGTGNDTAAILSGSSESGYYLRYLSSANRPNWEPWLEVSNQTGDFSAAGGKFYRVTATAAVTMPAANIDGRFMRIINVGSGTVTVNRAGSDTFFYGTSGLTSHTILPGECFTYTAYAAGTEWLVS